MTTADTQHTGLARAQVQASSPKELVHTTKRRAKTNKIKNLFMLLSPLQSPPPRRRHTGQTTDWLVAGWTTTTGQVIFMYAREGVLRELSQSQSPFRLHIHRLLLVIIITHVFPAFRPVLEGGSLSLYTVRSSPRSPKTVFFYCL